MAWGASEWISKHGYWSYSYSTITCSHHFWRFAVSLLQGHVVSCDLMPTYTVVLASALRTFMIFILKWGCISFFNILAKWAFWLCLGWNEQCTGNSSLMVRALVQNAFVLLSEMACHPSGLHTVTYEVINPTPQAGKQHFTQYFLRKWSASGMIWVLLNHGTHFHKMGRNLRLIII